MKKISTLFKKDPNDLGRVINEINPENAWALDKGVIATRKWDGSACAIINGILYKRYDVKKGREVPEEAIPCQDADAITGHWPHWISCARREKSDQWHFEAYDKEKVWIDGTYELCGPKIQGNPEHLSSHQLIYHGAKVFNTFYIDFEWIYSFLTVEDIEGVVLHQPLTGRMCKIRKSDFGIKRELTK